MRIIEYCITKETKNQNEYLYNEWQGNQATRRMTETTRQRQKHKQNMQATSRQKNKKGYNNKRNSKRTEVKTKILTQQQQK